MLLISHKLFPFDNAGYFFCGIVVVALFGFVPSYFPSFTGREVTFTFYTHIHAVVMSLWLLLLIAQPFLIRTGNLEWHRKLGRLSYILMPSVLIAGLLMIHDSLGRESDFPEGFLFYIGITDLTLVGTAFTLAMVHRKNPAYHARLIVGSTFQLLQPGLVRVLLAFLPIANPQAPLLVAWMIVDGILIYLVVKDRNLESGKWIFRLILGMTLTVQGFLLAGILAWPPFLELEAAFKGLNLT